MMTISKAALRVRAGGVRDVGLGVADRTLSTSRLVELGHSAAVAAATAGGSTGVLRRAGRQQAAALCGV